MTRWIEDPTLDAPDGHAWMKPAPDDCPNCDCCTAALCEKAVRLVAECWIYLSGADDETVKRVRECPCDRAPGTPAHQINELLKQAEDGTITDAQYTAAVEQIHADHPLD